MLQDQQILLRAQRVVSDVFFGTFTTVNGQGVPRSRYMGALAPRHGLGHLYALTAGGMSKADDLAVNPNVCWLFARPEFEEVVQLHGLARLITAPTLMQDLFNRLMVAARDQSLNILSQQANVEYQVIETRVDAIELLCPKLTTVPMRILPAPVAEDGLLPASPSFANTNHAAPRAHG